MKTHCHYAPPGAFAEHHPVICVVGIPNTNDLDGPRLLHHTMANMDTTDQPAAFRPFVCHTVRKWRYSFQTVQAVFLVACDPRRKEGRQNTLRRSVFRASHVLWAVQFLQSQPIPMHAQQGRHRFFSMRLLGSHPVCSLERMQQERVVAALLLFILLQKRCISILSLTPHAGAHGVSPSQERTTSILLLVVRLYAGSRQDAGARRGASGRRGAARTCSNSFPSE